MNTISDASKIIPRASIGAILVDSGHISLESAQRVVRLQKELGIRFGDAAVRLGLLSELEIKQALAQQFNYSYLSVDDSSVSQEVVAAFKPFGDVVEQFRVLRSQLMMRWFDAGIDRKTLAVVSVERQEGRSVTAANLAVVFSQLGAHTLLVDADLRNPRQHELFSLENKQGLSTLLAGRAPLGGIIVPIPGLNNLSVLPAGAVPPNPQELLSRPIFGELIKVLKHQYDVIIIDTAAGGEISDYQTIAKLSGAAVMVARKDMVLASRIQALSGALQYAGVTVVGTVLNSG